MPPKKAAPAPAIPPPKNTFFKPGFREPAKLVLPPPVITSRQSFAPRRSFLYNKQTGEPYAEWIENQAVCLETGEVLFESSGEYYQGGRKAVNHDAKFDFAPPTSRHPKDPTIVTQDVIDAGVLTLDDFKAGKSAMSVEMCEVFGTKKSA